MHYSYKTQNTCSRQIDFEIDGDVITQVKFTSGCKGNLKAISKLVDVSTVHQIEYTLLGNTCGANYTSCADQLARAVRQAYEETSAS